jgi:hypothetical protein
VDWTSIQRKARREKRVWIALFIVAAFGSSIWAVRRGPVRQAANLRAQLDEQCKRSESAMELPLAHLSALKEDLRAKWSRGRVSTIEARLDAITKWLRSLPYCEAHYPFFKRATEDVVAFRAWLDQTKEWAIDGLPLHQ